MVVEDFYKNENNYREENIIENKNKEFFIPKNTNDIIKIYFILGHLYSFTSQINTMADYGINSSITELKEKLNDIKEISTSVNLFLESFLNLE